MPGPCGRCGQYVGAAEQRLALGKCWHLECFTCAICNKGLDSFTLAEYRELEEIYCKSCYRQNIGIQGYGYGPNGPTLIVYDVPEEFQEHSEPQGSNTRKWEQPPTRLGKVFLKTRAIPPHYGHAGASLNLTRRGESKGQEGFLGEGRGLKSTPGSTKTVQESYKVSGKSSLASTTPESVATAAGTSNSRTSPSPAMRSNWSFQNPPPPTSLKSAPNNSPGSRPSTPISSAGNSRTRNYLPPPPPPPQFQINSSTRGNSRPPTPSPSPGGSYTRNASPVPPPPPPPPPPPSQTNSYSRGNSRGRTASPSPGGSYTRNGFSVPPPPPPPPPNVYSSSRGNSRPTTAIPSLESNLTGRVSSAPLKSNSRPQSVTRANQSYGQMTTPGPETSVSVNTDGNCPPLFFCGGKCVGTPSTPRYPPGPADGRRMPLGPNFGAVRTVPKGVGEPCRRCGRPVFHSELQLGYHGAYHTECFKCCSCGKKLDSTSVSEHQGEIFCTGCYRRNFAVHGVGFGIGAGALQTP